MDKPSSFFPYESNSNGAWVTILEEAVAVQMGIWTNVSPCHQQNLFFLIMKEEKHLCANSTTNEAMNNCVLIAQLMKPSME